MKKKTLLAALCAAALAFSAAGCSENPDNGGNTGMQAKGTIVATAYDNAEVKKDRRNAGGRRRYLASAGIHLKRRKQRYAHYGRVD